MIVREHSTLRLCWDSIILALVVYSCLLIPYQLVFLHSVELASNGLMQIISLVFLCDIALNFITSFRRTGEEILDPKAIRTHYLQGLFVFDLIANLPLDLLVSSIGDPQVGGYSLILLIRLLALLRLIRFFAILRRWESFS